MVGREEELVERLWNMDSYPELFAIAFPEYQEPVQIETMIKAISAFTRTIISADSSYDRFLQGDSSAMNESELRGMSLFFSDRLNCASCHSGLFLDRSLSDDGEISDSPGYFNTGLYNVDNAGGYPAEEVGLYSVTNNENDMGRFRVPSLRNVEITGPWGHDGSFSSLEDVIGAYARGGRLVQSGENAGDGADSPFIDPRLTGFSLTENELQDLLAFLFSLTDHSVLTNVSFANPFCTGFDSDLENCIEPKMGPGSDE